MITHCLEPSPAAYAPAARTALLDTTGGPSSRLHDWLEGAPGIRHLERFTDFESAWRRLPALRPDVMLVVLDESEKYAVEVVRELRLKAPETQIVVLTDQCDSRHVFTILGAGATGYLLKTTPREELLAAVREVHAGGAPLSSDVARLVVESFSHQSRPQTGLHTLSHQERAVLDLLASGCLYKEIADRLGIGINTVSTYVRRTYDKLQVRSRAQAVAKLFNLDESAAAPRRPHAVGH
ncbi:MAG: response regulator transcription factor [Opitutaceae bacterium]|nr:response regulator transcription factor [Cephaloticoccus sp.]MCP5529313.1 response regulator transcription factor [Opitutaceae bacterium]